MGFTFKLKSRQMDISSASMDELEDYLKPIMAEHLYPVGRIYISQESTNPVSLFGVGTWSAIQGYTLVGHGGASPLDGAAGTTYGATTHALSIAELASHRHTCAATSGSSAAQLDAGAAGFAGWSNTFSSYADVQKNGYPYLTNTGSGTAHNNVQPSYITYMWRRTS